MNVLFLFESVLPPDYFMSTVSPGELRIIAAQKQVGRILALGPEGESFYDVPGSKLKTVLERKIHIVRFSWPKNVLSYYFSWIGLVWHGWKLCKRGQIDVIHAESPHISGIAAHILRLWFHTKVVVEYRVSYDQLLDKRYGPFWGKILRFCFWLVAQPVMQRAQMVAANSMLYKHFIQKDRGISHVLCYNPGVRIPDDHGLIKHSGVRIGFLGRLYPDKGPEYVIEIAARYRSWWEANHVVFAVGGDGPLKDSLQRSVKIRGLSHLISFYGLVDRWNFLRYCDVLVNTTLVHPALEMAIAEAACMGIPCVTFGTEGYPETVRNGITGIIVPPMNMHALGAALKNLTVNTELRNKMAEAAKLHGKQFTFMYQKKQLGEMYACL